jgi:hypothetical protein
MSYTPDMKETEPRWFAVGWLHPDHPFPSRALPPEVVERISEFSQLWFESVDALGLPITMGYHTCEFCGVAEGSGMFAVPAHDRIFHCPEMIAHYVEHHQYGPPEAFIKAIMKCPLPGTPAYAELAAPFVLE